MRLYRGTRDIWPHRLDHHHKTVGLYGEAVYLATEEAAARFYALGGYNICQIVTSYEVKFKNLLEIPSSQWRGISNINNSQEPLTISPLLQEALDYQNSTLSPMSLAKILKSSGLDGALLTGIVEGGIQLVVPAMELLDYKIINYEIVLHKSVIEPNHQLIDPLINLVKSQGGLVQNLGPKIQINITQQQKNSLIKLFEILEKRSTSKSKIIDLEKLTGK